MQNLNNSNPVDVEELSYSACPDSQIWKTIKETPDTRVNEEFNNFYLPQQNLQVFEPNLQSFEMNPGFDFNFYNQQMLNLNSYAQNALPTFDFNQQNLLMVQQPKIDFEQNSIKQVSTSSIETADTGYSGQSSPTSVLSNEKHNYNALPTHLDQSFEAYASQNPELSNILFQEQQLPNFQNFQPVDFMPENQTLKDAPGKAKKKTRKPKVKKPTKVNCDCPNCEDIERQGKFGKIVFLQAVYRSLWHRLHDLIVEKKRVKNVSNYLYGSIL